MVYHCQSALRMRDAMTDSAQDRQRPHVRDHGIRPLPSQIPGECERYETKSLTPQFEQADIVRQQAEQFALGLHHDDVDPIPASQENLGQAQGHTLRSATAERRQDEGNSGVSFGHVDVIHLLKIIESAFPVLPALGEI